MKTETRTTNAKERMCLPKAFANSNVIDAQESEPGLRFSTTQVVSED